MLAMLALLFVEHRHRMVIQRHADRLAAFRFVGVNPSRATLHIDVMPFQSEHIGLS